MARPMMSRPEVGISVVELMKPMHGTALIVVLADHESRREDLDSE